MAEWLCSGLQSRVRRFDSGFSLHLKSMPNQKNVALIVARLSSSRLPKKNILPICNIPMISHLIHRVKRSKYVDEIIITTSKEESDDPFIDIARSEGVSIYRGSLEDIMQRVINAAIEAEADNIIEILGDNPLVDYRLIDDVAEIYFKNKSDYSATATVEYPKIDKSKKLFSVGLRVQMYSIDAACRYEEFKNTLSKDDHPSSFIFNNPDSFKLSFLEATDHWSFLNKPDLNFAVNYQKNFKLISKLFETFYPSNKDFTLNEIFDFLDQNQYLLELLGPE